MSNMYINKSQPMRLWLALPAPHVQEEQRQVVKSFRKDNKEENVSAGPRLFLGGTNE